MDYKKHYDILIERTRNQEKQPGYERHHIIPDSMFINRQRKGKPGILEGDPDAPGNIVFLTCREHYVAHLLLVKIYPDNRGLVYAARMMTFNSPDHKDGRSKNRLYSWLKEKYIEASTGQKRSSETKKNISNSLIDKPKSEEHKKNLRKPKKLKKSKKGIPTGIATSGCFEQGNIPWNKGKTHMIGDENPAFGKTWDQEKRDKMSKTNAGRIRKYRDDGTYYYEYPNRQEGVSV